MSATLSSEVAIIGAGLAGLTLALALHKNGIGCTLYELRPHSATTPGALMLSPNSLRILDNLGLYDRLKCQGFNFETVTFKNDKEETLDAYYLGMQKTYGYDCLRIYRQVLLRELRAAVEKAGIRVHYENKFTRIVDDTSAGVTFEFSDGSQHSASILVGADGIHSKVRKHITDVVPSYGGLLAITYAVQRSLVNFTKIEGEDQYPCPVAVYGARGAFVLAPQNIDGSELLAGTQRKYPELDKAGWDALAHNSNELKKLLQTDMDTWPPTAQSALSNIPSDKLSIWPYYSIPLLENWTSPTGKVVILGDAAHAIPPTAGQGASQAFEDVFTFAELLTRRNSVEQKAWLFETKKWQALRQQRIGNVVALTLQLNNTRLPAEEKAKLAKDDMWHSSSEGELAWLYDADIIGDMHLED